MTHSFKNKNLYDSLSPREKKKTTLSVPIYKHPLSLIKECLYIGKEGVQD